MNVYRLPPWPFPSSVGGKLVCAYSRGLAHTIGDGERGVYVRGSSDGGLTWGGEKLLVNDPAEGEVTIGKGLDSKGAMLLWVRCCGKKWHHDLYCTVDGEAFEKISSPALSPMPMQITDVFSVPGVGLMSLWFAGNANATSLGGRHFIAYYTGTPRDTDVRVIATAIPVDQK